MFRLIGFGIVPLALLALWVYCIFDVISADATLIRNLPKGFWIVLVIFLPDIGSIAWLALGRPLYASWRPGDTGSRPAPRRVVGPEDNPEFTRPPRREGPTPKEASLQAWEDDLLRRERELRQGEGEDPPPAT